MGLEPVFAEENWGHNCEAGGKEGEAGEHRGHGGEDGEGHNLLEAAATLAVMNFNELISIIGKLIFFWDTDLPIHQEYRPNLPAISP